MSVGAPGAERRITNVAPGIAGTDAVNVNQLQSSTSGLQQQIQSTAFALQGQISGVQKEARRGVAAALATNGLMTPTAPGRTTVSVTGGFFQGESAVGVTAAHRLYAWPAVVLYGSYANGGGNEHAGKVGAGFEF